MKNTKDFATLVMEKKATLEILEILMEKLSSLEDDYTKEWACTGETEQKTSWNRETEKSEKVWLDADGNRTFENTGVPCMVDCYDYMPKKEYTEKDKAQLEALNKVRETLASLA